LVGTRVAVGGTAVVVFVDTGVAVGSGVSVTGGGGVNVGRSAARVGTTVGVLTSAKKLSARQARTRNVTARNIMKNKLVEVRLFKYQDHNEFFCLQHLRR
jgi:hypothetical protein